MAEVVELRVHGVGGTPAEGLLGVDGPVDLVRAGGDDAAPFMARKYDRLTEGYVWGKLTSKGLLQPFWLLLLPFTMVNVSGWAHRPVSDLRRGGWPLSAIRLLVHLVGLTLTGTYVIWLAHVAFNRLIGLDRVLFAESYDAKLWLGFGASCVTIALVFVIARNVQKGFEGFGGPGDLSPQPRAGLFKTIASAVRRSDDLSASRFWKRSGQARVLLWLHLIVAGAAAVLSLVWALFRADPRRAGAVDGGVNLETGLLIEWATWALLTGLVLIWAVHLIGWRVGAPGRGMFRLTGPMTP
ncbi:MAG TPA: hypothetical protein VEA19_07670, partial [Actinomycetota bacterium]|nr:hypothetical protein [Actinomycetota bacterium]